eukprot:6714033-Alexandrium_andersonii.AAC.1
MSASLVGSEMCIRDRKNIMIAPVPAWPRPENHQSERAGRMRRIGRDRAICLLYTSDAADDM